MKNYVVKLVGVILLFIFSINIMVVNIMTVNAAEITAEVSIEVKAGMEQNLILMQTFYWEMNRGEYAEEHPEEAYLWQLLADRAYYLSDLGFTGLWLPPANKADGGEDDEGYAAYDLWDLGEFHQKGSIRTKYGTKPGLEWAVKILRQNGIDIYYDAVFNHRMGGDRLEDVVLNGEEVETASSFKLLGRDDHYSNADIWKWNWLCFDGINSMLFSNKTWDSTVDKDYLMGYDVDYQNELVVEEMKEWGEWIVNDIGFDGFRIDAVKHIDNDFINEWVYHLQSKSEKDLIFLSEAWYEDVMGLILYLNEMNNGNIRVFDFALRRAFSYMSEGQLNMNSLARAGLVNREGYGDRVVTFVDNHDTGRDEVEYTPAISRRKLQAYTYILCRADGIPMVFWKDFYNSGIKEEMERLILARKYFAYGPGYEMSDDSGNDTNDSDIYSYVREGLKDIPGTGLVMMIAGGDSRELVSKKINSYQENQAYYDFTGNVHGVIRTDSEGYADFKVYDSEDKGWAVWVPLL
ncbi:MAG: alpha-amylase family glycosyl hydrolase [Halanaerobiales bacterium]